MQLPVDIPHRAFVADGARGLALVVVADAASAAEHTPRPSLLVLTERVHARVPLPLRAGAVGRLWHVE